MAMDEHGADGVFRHRFIVPHDAEDENGHVNNVVYVQWMQDIAIRHATAAGATAAARSLGCSWVARSHQIEYRVPAYAGDSIEAVTWIASCHGVRSVRRYRFVRTSDAKVLAVGETQWVFVSLAGGRPQPIPESVRQCFTPVAGPPA